MKAEIKDLDVKDLDKVADSLGEGFMRAVEETARGVQAEAKRLVPVDSGDLQKAISVRVKTSHAEVYVDTSRAYYGHFVEFGIKGRPAKPFMVPAAELERKKFKERLKKAVD